MKAEPMTGKAKNVDEYLSALPEKERAVLEELRRIIKAAAPMAEERISYGMPGFMYRGPLVFFAAQKHHLGFYGVSREVIDRFQDDLAPYRTSTTTLHFSADNPLPALLVTKIVKARVEENDKRTAEKKRYGK